MQSAIDIFKSACKSSRTEEDVRVATLIYISELSKYLGIQNRSSSEVTYIYGGRADSVYQNLIFEFKGPRKFRTGQGVDEALYGRDNSDRGLFHYLVNSALQDETVVDDESFMQVLCSKVGVGFDGTNFIFARFRSDSNEMNLHEKNKTIWKKNIRKSLPLKFEMEISIDFDSGLRKLSLLARSTKKKLLSADTLLNSFSHEVELSQETISYFYQLLTVSLRTNPRVRTLFDEWMRIFGEIYGEKETDFTLYKDELIEMYDLPKKLDIKKCLFVLQTYYSAVIKLLVQNLLFSLSNPLEKAQKPKYRSDLTSLFSGSHSSQSSIENFFEIHFFEWFILCEELDISYMHRIIEEIDQFETTASVIRPEVVRDVLKRVYQSLIPRGLRHLMGEYYTPDWLVDFTIEKSGYKYSTDETVLDPTCGSGTFLTHLIAGINEKSQLSSTEKISKIVKSVVGFDINPIAVVSAKANYILALGDVSGLEKKISIPVYMCDSILVPTVHAKQIEDNNAIEIETVVGTFKIPYFSSREETDSFLNLMSKSILTDYTSFAEFYGLFVSETGRQLSESQTRLASELYEKLHSLHLSSRDGFWPVILKNSFAPLFSHDKFDFVVGNPPWITWKAMSDSYRKMTLDIWLSYGIFEKNAYDKITSHDDFAMAVTYVCIDHYLKNQGTAIFILPQTFVKSSKGGEGFRKFTITRDGLEIPFAIDEVYDMLLVNPFKGEASNRSSVYRFKKNQKMTYPMKKYFECFIKDNKNPINYVDSWAEVSEKLGVRQLEAQPINNDIRSPWLTMESNLRSNVENLLGESFYRARKGIEPCGAKGIYLVKCERSTNGQVQIENLIERSRLEKAKKLGVRQGKVEPDFIYPMVGGRNFDKWGLNSYLHMVVPHFSEGVGIYRGVDVSTLKASYPKLYNWLFYFKDLLLETRIRSGKFFDPSQFPFYRLDNVGDYTFAKFKVLWKEQSKYMTAVVVSDIEDTALGKKNVVTDSKVLFVSLDSEDEAHYLCGVLNSRLIGRVVEAYTIDVQKGVDIVKNIRIPQYADQNPIHQSISKFSKLAHMAYLEGDKTAIERIERNLEEVVPEVFNTL